MKLLRILLLCLLPLFGNNITLPDKVNLSASQPTISFTFDDGKTSDLAGYKLTDWHGRILAALHKHQLKAIMFVAGHNKKTVNGKYVLSTWNDAGHRLANHTLNHPNFNADEVTLDMYKQELLANDAIIKQYSNYMRYFRFPYLKEGNTIEKINGFRQFLTQQNYSVGHVSIDCADWYIDSRLRNRLIENPNSDITSFKTFYINHIYQKAVYYDSISTALTGRHVKHSLLLHHNLVSALFLDELIVHFKQKGWKVIDADKAYTDLFYQQTPNSNPAGESLTWALAKQSGRFEQVLRYPAEGDMYEKEAMDKLGL